MKPKLESEGTSMGTLLGVVVAVLGIVAGAMVGPVLHPEPRRAHAQSRAAEPLVASPRVEPAVFESCPLEPTGCDA